MKIASIAVAVLSAVAMTASPARADALTEVEQLQQQTSDLHATWNSLSPAQRQQRLAQLQQQSVVVQNDEQNLPPEQRPEVQARLTVVTLELADILRMAWPAP